MPILRIALAQINPAVGNLRGNVEKIISFIEEAKSFGADIVVFPELSTVGSPPYDLLFCKSFLRETEGETKKIVSHTKSITAVVGSICREGSSLFNTAYVMSNGNLVTVYFKRLLRELCRFNEREYFSPGEKPCILEMEGSLIQLIMGDEVEEFAIKDKISLYLVMDSSFYRFGEIWKKRTKIIKSLHPGTVGYVNLTGGQDEWIFYGGSFLSTNGKIVVESPIFHEHLLVCDVNLEEKDSLLGAIKLKKMSRPHAPLSMKKEKLRYAPEDEILSALIVSTGDYVKKNGFRRVFIGLSGGIDSAVVAYIASKAVGRENVTCLFMPTRYTSEQSYEDAKEVAKNLGVDFIEIPVDSLFESYLDILKGYMGGELMDITAENLQPRIRANILMAFSNNFEGLVLTTGNKSEIATGYCTLYGDTAGGFSVLKDIPKTLVYKLAEHINKKEGFHVIPKRVFEKPPSAELKYNQKDSDTLPPYDLLDVVIRDYIENQKRSKKGKSRFDQKIVADIIGRFLKNEYKRRQGPTGPILFPGSLGMELNFPVTNVWRYKK